MKVQLVFRMHSWSKNLKCISKLNWLIKRSLKPVHNFYSLMVSNSHKRSQQAKMWLYDIAFHGLSKNIYNYISFLINRKVNDDGFWRKQALPFMQNTLCHSICKQYLCRTRSPWSRAHRLQLVCTEGNTHNLKQLLCSMSCWSKLYS